ncbi:NF-kappa-B inhibitor cactus-like [Teleopsis dalmanni]|uniref:NF-kappa-B inhibitor cactus-like n=1 Tax=Teleopsis dalmanni TaxID=139649 RepID=UPI0018CCB485|nr:NF-kappa-B inhibitor cactus-like [Teleopsis dalmanni]
MSTKTSCDNRKKANVEDNSSNEVASDVTQQQQNQRKGSIKPTGLEEKEASCKKMRKLQIANAEVSESGDSGFISGQILTTIDESEGAVGNSSDDVLEQYDQKQDYHPTEDKELEKVVVDSGCIVGDDNEVSINQDHHELSEQQEEIQREHSNPTVAVTISSASNVDNKSLTTTAAGQIIPKQNINDEMSKMLNNLNLDTKTTTHPQQQQQQPQPKKLIFENVKNLNAIQSRLAAAFKRSTPTTTTGNNNQNSTTNDQQQEVIGETGSVITSPTSGLLPSDAWEQFYQQDNNGDTILHLACRYGYVKVVATLIRMAPHPCLFNIQNDAALTPLHCAAIAEETKILRLLLIAGAEPTLRDKRGNTALHIACIIGEEQCVRALTVPISTSEIDQAHYLFDRSSDEETVSSFNYVRLPSDLEISNYDGKRCVHLAALAEHIDILRILVCYGADINARERKAGYTPLHMATESRNKALANFLFDECQKLNIETPTYAGLTAYQLAGVLQYSQWQNILVKRGAQPIPPPDRD